MEKPEHIVRMESEADALENTIDKAQNFLDTDGRRMLNRFQVLLLNIQIDAMRSYLRVLKARIEYDGALALHAEYDDDNLALGAGDANAVES